MLFCISKIPVNLPAGVIGADFSPHPVIPVGSNLPYEKREVSVQD
jgi:hypothetical protein